MAGGMFKKILRAVAPIAVGLIPGIGPITAGVLRAGIGGLSAASAARDAKKEQAGQAAQAQAQAAQMPQPQQGIASLKPEDRINPYDPADVQRYGALSNQGIPSYLGPQPAPAAPAHLPPMLAQFQDDQETQQLAYGGPVYLAEGGIAGLAPHEYKAGGRYLSGPGDGMSDDIKANIDGQQEARLADGEFVIPADVVSHLGNGSSNAGAKKLHEMMARIRHARTGNPKQGKQVKPEKYLPA